MARTTDRAGTSAQLARSPVSSRRRRDPMGKAALLWLIGIPLPLVLILWLFFFR